MALINALNCNKENLGLGVVECEARLKDFKSFFLVPKSWRITLTELETLTLPEIVGLVQNDTWQPFLNSVEFVNNTPDPTTKEYTGGVMSVIRNGKPQYSFEFDNGIGFHKAAYSKNSFNNYNVIIVDSAGTLVGAVTADGLSFTGLTASMVNTRTYVPQVGDETAKTLVEFQLSNEDQFNKRMAIITTDQSGVDVNSELMGVIGVNIAATASVASGFNVDVTAVNNTIFGIEGLVVDNFRVINTVTNAVLAIDTVVAGTVPGNYVIDTTTPPTASTSYILEMYDATATPPTNTALVGDNQLYRGQSLPIVATA